MSKNWTYKSGDWNLICDVCSIKIKASESKKRWDGFIVCKGCWEPRHSMDFIRTRKEKISVPFTRPIPQDNYTSTSYITIYVGDGWVEDSGIGTPRTTYFVEIF